MVAIVKKPTQTNPNGVIKISKFKEIVMQDNPSVSQLIKENSNENNNFK